MNRAQLNLGFRAVVRRDSEIRAKSRNRPRDRMVKEGILVRDEETGLYSHTPTPAVPRIASPEPMSGKVQLLCMILGPALGTFCLIVLMSPFDNGIGVGVRFICLFLSMCFYAAPAIATMSMIESNRGKG